MDIKNFGRFGLMEDAMCLAKYESMLQWAKNSFKENRELRNYWEWRSWGSKYRHHGQYNGKKPKWRKQRKQERRFRELQKVA